MRVVVFFAFVVVIGCGRSPPDPVAFVDKVGAQEAAREVCFSDESQLRALLDDDYLAIDTPLLDTVAVEATARATCFDTIDELTDLLDDVYLPADTTVLTNADIEGVARGVCFDTEAELHAALDDDYLDIAYQPTWNEILNKPAGFADDVDNDTPPTATAPLNVTGRNVSISTTGCNAGDSLVLQGTAFVCRPPAAPRSTERVGAAAANTNPLDALPIIVKFEALTQAVTSGTPRAVAIFPNGGTRASKGFLIVDAWAVGLADSVAAQWSLRKGAGTQVTGLVNVPRLTGDVERLTKFVGNATARTIGTADDLSVVLETQGANETVSLTVYVLGIPL